MPSITPLDLQTLTSSPTAIVEAINDRLSQVSALDQRFHELTGRYVADRVPFSVSDNSIPVLTGVNYDILTGVTPPREDGAVRVKVWDDFVEKALNSSSEPTRRWAAARAVQPWIFIQDTLAVAGLNKQQRLNIGTNCSNSRMLNAFLGGSNYKGWSWIAYPVILKDDGTFQLSENEIPDAFAVSDDLVTLSGQVKSKGWRIADLGMLAERTLAHFLLTSGASTAPLGSNPFGRT